MIVLLTIFTATLAILYFIYAQQSNLLKNDAKIPKHQWTSHRITFFNFGLVLILGVCASLYQQINLNDRVVEIPKTTKIVLRDTIILPTKQAEVELAPSVIKAPTVVCCDKLPEVNASTLPPPPTMISCYYPIIEMPSFPGCVADSLNKTELRHCAQEKMIDHIYSQLVYPKEAKDQGLEGTCVVNFIVEADGSLSRIRVLRDIGGGTAEECIRIVNSFPKWVAGNHNGVAKPVAYNLPIKFKLNE